VSEPAAFAVTHPGLETILAAELSAIGAVPQAPTPGGVEFPFTPELLARANLCLRTAGRILVRVAEFHARTFAELERHLLRISWDRWLPAGAPAHVRVTTKKSKLYHERALVERFAMAITARCPKTSILAARGEAEAESHDPDSTLQRFVVRVFRDQVTVSVDTSGALLHRRGYRVDQAKAPLRETLAAGLVLGSGWSGATPLVDPMCGSGTIPIEAALLARRIPPGWRRTFAFERWPEMRDGSMARVRAELEERILPRAPAPIVGTDRDDGAIAAAVVNAERAGVAGDIEFRRAPISALAPPPGPGVLMVNPPYGGRIGDAGNLRDLYAQLGNVARRVAGGWDLVMIGADRALERQVGLAWRELLRTENGGIPIRFLAASVPTP